MEKTITFAIPCYNSAAYLDRCVKSIVEGSACAEDVQVVIVDDGSDKDDTLALALAWHKRYPKIVEVVHQKNGGHGMAVLAGLERARGAYFRVVDSDDWLDASALMSLLFLLRTLTCQERPVDLVVTNYVYEHVCDNTRRTVHYHRALPKGKVIGWEDTGHFNVMQNMLMHSLTYRTEVLRSGPVPLPAHTSYEDNIYAYVPLPRCKTLYYLDVDLYRYFIGREDQSVSESVMVANVDQQLRITRIMMGAYRLGQDVPSRKLRRYMQGYLTMMFAICSVLTALSGQEGAKEDLEALWAELKEHDAGMYRAARHGLVGTVSGIPNLLGTKAATFIYRGAQKICKFN